MSNRRVLGALKRGAWLASLAAMSWAGAASGEPADAAPTADPTLARLVRESLSALPEMAAAEHAVRAQEARVSQAGAWSDPVLQLGIQNDGFDGIQIGHMETSFASVMVSQTVPWPGKTGAREDVTKLAVTQARRGVSRIQLSTVADVRRAYLDLLLVRDQRALLKEREGLWRRSLETARFKYESGSGAQVDLLRAQLELTRVQQQFVELDARERSSLQLLNRMRHKPLDTAIPTTGSIGQLPPVAGQERSFSGDRAVALSPELAVARLEIQRAGKQVELAQRSYYPDLTLGAGFMYRGSLPPMWLVTVAAPVPVFSSSKQGAAVTENRALGQAAREQARALEQMIRLRSEERRSAFLALSSTLRIYEQGLLAQSSATTDAALTQYQVGRTSFASVLDAIAGLISDRQSYLQARAEAERLLIAEQEISLLGVALPSGGGSGASMAGTMSVQAASTASSPSAAPASPSASAAVPASGGAMSGM